MILSTYTWVVGVEVILSTYSIALFLAPAACRRVCCSANRSTSSFSFFKSLSTFGGQVLFVSFLDEVKGGHTRY
jgi:hypothetical protein